jgi:hypothetical protein
MNYATETIGLAKNLIASANPVTRGVYADICAKRLNCNRNFIFYLFYL